VERDRGARGKLAALGALGSLVREHAEADERSAGIAGAVMGVVDREAGRETRRARRRAAAVRGYYVVGAAVLAAAAAMLWTRQEAPAPSASKITPTPNAAAATEAPATASQPQEHGVEVWSVDFGAASGAVFYVPSESSASGTTTVVWVSADDTAGDEDE
jgi:hypothetical protein